MVQDDKNEPRHTGPGWVVWADVLTNLINKVARFGFLGWLVYQLRYMVEALAGKDTSAVFVVDWFSGTRCGLAVSGALALAGVAVTWAVGERFFRRRQNRRMSGTIQRLESRLDPDRSSSGLEKDGTTHPRDDY